MEMTDKRCFTELTESRGNRRKWGREVVDEHKRRLTKRRGYVNSEGRLVNTREYAIAWGVINKPYSDEELRKKCRDPDAPSYHYITKSEWKGYTRYYRALVSAGMEPRPPRTDNERRHLIGKAAHDGFIIGLLEKDYDIAKIAAGYGVDSMESYKRIREEHPESKCFLPPTRTIQNRFGTWRRFMYEVMKYNADAVLTEQQNRLLEQVEG